VQIDRQQLIVLQSRGFTAVQMAEHFGCSAPVIYKKLAAENLHMRRKYNDISDSDLDHTTADVHQAHPSAGNEVIACFCLS